MEAVAVRDVYIPCEEIRKDDDGTNWLKFFYTDDDKDPWKWPKVLKYDGMFFKWLLFWETNFVTLGCAICCKYCAPLSSLQFRVNWD